MAHTEDNWIIGEHPPIAKNWNFRFHHAKGAADGYSTVSQDMIECLALKGWGIDMKAPVAVSYELPINDDRIYQLEHETKYKICYTMLETTKLPAGMPERLNRFNEIWTPSEYMKKMFIKNGVTVPIYPMPHGINPLVFLPIERHKRKPFKYFMYNAFGVERKGWKELIEVFKEMRKENKNIELHLKTIYKNIPDEAQGEGITVTSKIVHRNELARLAGDYDCFVFPSRGEGFGLTPCEMLATAMPTIVTNASGMTEYFDEAYMYGIKTKGQQKVKHPFLKGDVGTEFIIDKADLKKQMQYVYDNYDEALVKAKKGSEYIRTKFTYETFANLMIERLKAAYQFIDMPITDAELVASVESDKNAIWVINPKGKGVFVSREFARERGWHDDEGKPY